MSTLKDITEAVKVVKAAREELATALVTLEAEWNREGSDVAEAKAILFFCHDSGIISDEEYSAAVRYLQILLAPPPEDHWWKRESKTAGGPKGPLPPEE